MDDWLAQAKDLPRAHALTIDALRDHIPEFLDRLADAIERDDLTAVTMRGLPNVHAAMRVRDGYDLRHVVAEYRAIRSVILRLYREQGDISEESRPKLTPLAAMDAVLDNAIADAVDQYALDQGKAREMFIGMLGHDLRDPLNAITFTAHRLLNRGDELDAQTGTFAARIAASAHRMDAMIRDLLDFARGRLGGGFPTVPTPFDVRTIIADTVNEIAHAHPERTFLSPPAEARGDFHVQWDKDRIAQALTNLLSNAVAHGGDPIIVEAHDREHSITIAVRNAGEIPAPALATIFAPFAPPATERRHDGPYTAPERRRGHLGLGLYIVHEVAKAHGGHVSAQSERGETTFALTLPRAATAPDSSGMPNGRSADAIVGSN